MVDDAADSYERPDVKEVLVVEVDVDVTLDPGSLGAVGADADDRVTFASEAMTYDAIALREVFLHVVCGV